MIFKGKDVTYLVLLVIVNVLVIILYNTWFKGMCITSTEFKYLITTLLFSDLILLLAFLHSNIEKEDVIYDPWDL